MSQWDDLDEYDRAWALALAHDQAEREAAKCPQCGGPALICQDHVNQHAYEVTWRRCYRTSAVRAAEKLRKDHDGVMAVVTLNPAKKKPPKS